MRVFLAVVVVAAGLVGTVLAAEDEAITEDQAQQLALRAEVRMRELDVLAREMELDFQRQMHEVELARHSAMLDRRGGREGAKGVILLLMILVRAFATVWVYKDIQERKKGSGLWIPIVLIGGLAGLIGYGVIRMAEACEAVRATGAQND